MLLTNTLTVWCLTSPRFLLDPTHNYPAVNMPLFNLDVFDSDPQAYIESMTIREFTEYFGNIDYQ